MKRYLVWHSRPRLCRPIPHGRGRPCHTSLR
jgi:hypothetical protein